MYRSASEQPIWVNERQWSCRRHVPSAKYPASVDFCLLGCKHIVRPPLELRPGFGEPKVAEPTPMNDPKPAAPEVWRQFNSLTIPALQQQTLGNLRKYATHVLGVPRASKIPGGKPALLAQILLQPRVAA